MALYKKKGDIFVVKLDDKHRKYFQFIDTDKTQLGSHVIRVFERIYKSTDKPDLDEIAHGEVEFHAHVILQIGVKHGLWEKIGNTNYIEPIVTYFREMGYVHDQKLLFRDPELYRRLTDARQKVSENWSVWRPNEPFQFVGKLPAKYKTAEIGLVINPYDLVNRIKTGKYKFIYPEIEETRAATIK